MKLTTEIKYIGKSLGSIYNYGAQLKIDDKIIKGMETDLLWYARLWAWWQINFYRPSGDSEISKNIISKKEKEV